MNITLPKSIKVGPYIFSIIARSENWSHENECAGLCRTDHHSIDVVTERRTAGFVLDTLLHEIQHAIWWTMDLKELKDVKDEDREEEVVRRMATGWAMVYVDNPGLIEFIEEATDEIRGDRHG